MIAMSIARFATLASWKKKLIMVLAQPKAFS